LKKSEGKRNSKKTDQELEQDINSKESTVKELIPEAGSTHPGPSPMPEKGPQQQELTPPAHPRQLAVNLSQFTTSHHDRHVQDRGEENEGCST
jgi:hypothetical protein